MEINYNLITVGTISANRKVFDYEKIRLDKKYYRGTFKRFVDKHLDMVITIRKYIQTLQVISTKITKCVGKINRRKGGF